MRRVLTAAAAAALLASANSAHAFFHLLFQTQPPQQQYNQQYYQQYYQGAPGSPVQISPIPREVVAWSGYTPGPADHVLVPFDRLSHRGSPRAATPASTSASSASNIIGIL